jgi:hypothetical protein
MSRERMRTPALAVAGVVLVLLVGAGLVLLLPGSTTRIESAADGLAVPSSWTLTDERVTPPRRACLGASPCPSLHRTWETGRPLGTAEVEALLADSGWNLTLDGDCTTDPASFGRYEVCAAHGTVGDFVATFSHDASAEDPADAQVQLYLRPAP